MRAAASAEHIALIRAASTYQIIFGGNYFDGLGPTICWLIWDKQNGDNDFADCELAWTNLPKAVRRIEEAHRQADLFVSKPAPRKPEQGALL